MEQLQRLLVKRDSVKERKITELTNTTVNTQNSLSEKKQISTQFLHRFFLQIFQNSFQDV